MDHASQSFPRRLRLIRPAEFKAVYAARTRRRAGPLLVWSRPNGLDHPRLGLAIARRVGGAVVRNAVKRRLREAFRLLRHELPPGYDLVVSAAAHDPLPMNAYRSMLREAAVALDRTWTKRSGAGQEDAS